MLKGHLHVIALIAGWLGAMQVASATITLDHAQITDVTPSSFAIVWHASEVSIPEVEVFLDAAATQDITSLVEVIPYPLQAGAIDLTTLYEQAQSRRTLQLDANQKGLNKILVRGLDPATQYYIRASAVNATDRGHWPAAGTQPVITQNENGFLLDSAIVVVDLQDPDARGWIVTASTPTATHPVSSIAEAGAKPGQAVLNISNLFGSDGTNWYSELSTVLTIQVIKGSGELVSETLDINLSSSFEVASSYPFDFGTTFEAIIQIVSPSEKVYSRGESVALVWTDQADGVNATISLYIDVDTSGEDGVLIASGIDEDTDGSGDRYDWDVSTVSDGSYYIYAVMSDGENSVSAYGSSKITIDLTQIDSDSDQMSDLWELHYFDSLAREGSGDFDLDTVPDWLEHFYQVNPEQANAPLQGLALGLRQGSQIIGVPGMLVPRVDSYGLLTQLGTDIYSISRYNPQSGLLETAYWEAGAPAGDVFYLLPGEGYFVHMTADADLIWSPFDNDKRIPLRQGVNVIAITDPSGDAFGLLGQLGNDVIWSIRRQDALTSLYETAAYDGIDKVGIPFPLRYGEGYIVTVKRDAILD